MKPNIISLLPALLLLIFYTGCSPSADAEAEQKALLETDQAFARASLEHGAAEAFRIYLAEDALALPAGSQPVIGRETIYQRMSSISGSILAWEPRQAEVARSGDLGWTWGTYEVRSPGEDSRVLAYGKYVNVWRKQADGSWKVIVDIGNQSPPPEDASTP
jgi:ketosteroid isomerase-like protein